MHINLQVHAPAQDTSTARPTGNCVGDACTLLFQCARPANL